jgi:hypothetical protein
MVSGSRLVIKIRSPQFACFSRLGKPIAQTHTRTPLVDSAIDSNGRTIWIADAHRDEGRRFVMHADEKLTAFLEAISAFITTL